MSVKRLVRPSSTTVRGIAVPARRRDSSRRCPRTTAAESDMWYMPDQRAIDRLTAAAAATLRLFSAAEAGHGLLGEALRHRAGAADREHAAAGEGHVEDVLTVLSAVALAPGRVDHPAPAQPGLDLPEVHRLHRQRDRPAAAA